MRAFSCAAQAHEAEAVPAHALLSHADDQVVVAPSCRDVGAVALDDAGDDRLVAVMEAVGPQHGHEEQVEVLVVQTLEHVVHGGEVVEHQRGEKREDRREQRVPGHDLGEDHEQGVVDERRRDAHAGEPDELLDEGVRAHGRRPSPRAAARADVKDVPMPHTVLLCT